MLITFASIALVGVARQPQAQQAGRIPAFARLAARVKIEFSDVNRFQRGFVVRGRVARCCDRSHLSRRRVRLTFDLRRNGRAMAFILNQDQTLRSEYGREPRVQKRVGNHRSCHARINTAHLGKESNGALSRTRRIQIMNRILATATQAGGIRSQGSSRCRAPASAAAPSRELICIAAAREGAGPHHGAQGGRRAHKRRAPGRARPPWVGPDEPVPFGPYASSWVLATSASLSLRAWDSSRVSPLLNR